ncbi:hypothetical protein WMF45_46560 [Sorangium sp. So ce448]|uniref:hypothetical protein n=1 Tax=Sorangium sp. So ce448 TaxID=3133314 RepID=UPI003F5EB9A1
MTRLSLLLPLLAVGCGIDLGPYEEGPAPCFGGSCAPEPPESVCREYLTADRAVDGCGVFVHSMFGDDANPGSQDKPVLTLQRAIEIARNGRGRVFFCTHMIGSVTVPSGVDLIGSFNCLDGTWERLAEGSYPVVQTLDDTVPITIEPARPDDTGAEDGVTTIVGMRVSAGSEVAVFVRSGTEVEIIGSLILGSSSYKTEHGQDWSGPPVAPRGVNGKGGEFGCTGEIVAGGAAVVSPCDEGPVSMGGKGGDGGVADGGDGEDGLPMPNSDDPRGTGLRGRGDHGSGSCEDGQDGQSGARGADGAPGQGMGRITEAGWIGGKAGDGATGEPGHGGGGGGGRRGSLAICEKANLAGPPGGGGGSGGCGGKGGEGGDNATPSIGILALHAKVTVRDSEVATVYPLGAGRGGAPQVGGNPGFGAAGAYWPDGSGRACDGGDGGYGGWGGYGGGGRGGDSIGIAYLDEDQLVLENVTFDLGEPSEGGMGNPNDPSTWGERGKRYETYRFPE